MKMLTLDFGKYALPLGGITAFSTAYKSSPADLDVLLLGMRASFFSKVTNSGSSRSSKRGSFPFGSWIRSALRAGISSNDFQMAGPNVDMQMLRELESMGFPTSRATRALHFSGNSSIEAAITWVLDHENDPDIDQMPLVPINIQIEDGTSWMSPDEVMLRLQKLRELARKKRDEEEMQSERKREKDRIQSGKELMEAKRINEENERKRMLLLRKAEKNEENRAREKIRQKLKEDKAERRRKLGLEHQDPRDAKLALPVQEKKMAIPTKPTVRAEHMRECLRSLKKNNNDDHASVKRAYQTLAIYVRNVAKNPNEEKFRKIRVDNPNFQERIARLKGAIEFLELCGYEKIDGGEHLYLPREKVDMTALNNALKQLYSAMENPFFGVL